jgi:hypothetical protein
MTNVYTTIAAIMATGLLLLMQCPGARASSNFSVAPRTLTMHSDGTCECQVRETFLNRQRRFFLFIFFIIFFCKNTVNLFCDLRYR